MKPILMNGESVRGILEGRKTQTRRVIKPQPIVAFWQGSAPQFQFTGFKLYSPGYDRNTLRQFCPYGQVGDRLWVRETWRAFQDEHHRLGIRYKAGGQKFGISQKILWRLAHYDSRWFPSIHMDRTSSCITLEITGVKVERILDITLSDIRAEGISRLPIGLEERLGFADLWDSINAKRGYGWDVNPWVWALTFKVV